MTTTSKTLPFLVVLLTMASASFGQQASPRPKGGKTIVNTEQAPQPIGPYSQGVIANGFLFVAGQVGADPRTRQLVSGGLEAEATQVMENIGAILKAAHLDFGQVVKTTIYLKDISQFARVNELYGKYFTSGPPARETVQVANLPGNASIEISVVAALGQ
jgi:2-iminobutanoate/2-iminopropanoate deaminase